MGDARQPVPGPFDVATVRELVQMMEKFDLSEVDLFEGDQRIKLRRGARHVTAHAAVASLHPAPVAQATPIATATTSDEPLAGFSSGLYCKSSKLKNGPFSTSGPISTSALAIVTPDRTATVTLVAAL